MKDIKDVLLYLDSFDENNMFDFEHNNKLYYVSEVLRFKMYDRIEKYNLNYCEGVIVSKYISGICTNINVSSTYKE